MPQTKPVLRAMYAEWEDGEREYSDVDDPDDVRMYVVARKESEYHLRREEGDDEQEVWEYRYKLFDPDELSVTEMDDMREGGWEFVDVSLRDLTLWMHERFSS